MQLSQSGYFPPPRRPPPPPFGDITFRQNKQGGFAWARAGGWHPGPTQQQVETPRSLQTGPCKTITKLTHRSTFVFKSRERLLPQPEVMFYCISCITPKLLCRRTAVLSLSPCSKPRKRRGRWGRAPRTPPPPPPLPAAGQTPAHVRGRAWPERQRGKKHAGKAVTPSPGDRHSALTSPGDRRHFVLTQGAGSDGRQVIAPLPWHRRTPPGSGKSWELPGFLAGDAGWPRPWASSSGRRGKESGTETGTWRGLCPEDAVAALSPRSPWDKRRAQRDPQSFLLHHVKKQPSCSVLGLSRHRCDVSTCQGAEFGLSWLSWGDPS